MASVTPAAQPSTVPHQSLPTQAFNLVQKVAQEVFNTFVCIATLPAALFSKRSIVMHVLYSGSSTAFQVCCAVCSIFDSNALQKAFQKAFRDDPNSLGYVERIQILVKQGANPNLPSTSFSDNPTFWFLNQFFRDQTQKNKLFEWLLEHGADPNFNGSSEPLYQAILMKDLKAVNTLLEHGANPNLPCRGPRSLMQEAFYFRNFINNPDAVEMIKRLIEKGANPNVASTPLFNNPTFGFLGNLSLDQTQKNGLLKWLLEHGADPNFNDSSEPLTLVISEENLEAIELLLQHGADPNLTCLIDVGLNSEHRSSAKAFAKKARPQIYARFWGST